MKFSNQVVVVVGGSSGIGFATAKAAHAGGVDWQDDLKIA